jgi:hypothetical protein
LGAIFEAGEVANGEADDLGAGGQGGGDGAGAFVPDFDAGGGKDAIEEEFGALQVGSAMGIGDDNANVAEMGGNLAEEEADVTLRPDPEPGIFGVAFANAGTVVDEAVRGEGGGGGGGSPRRGG